MYHGGFIHYGRYRRILNRCFGFEILKSKSSTKPLPAPRVSYWYYKGNMDLDNSPKKSQQPIVFVHGIGAGLIGYCNFIRKLQKLNHPLFLVDLPYVTMQLVEDVPTMNETVHEIG